VAALAVPVVDLFGPAWTLAVHRRPTSRLRSRIRRRRTGRGGRDRPSDAPGRAGHTGRCGQVAYRLRQQPSPFTEAAAPASLPFDWAAALCASGRRRCSFCCASPPGSHGQLIAARATRVADGMAGLARSSIAALGVTARVVEDERAITIPMAAGL
jgi:hypothetical protein